MAPISIIGTVATNILNSNFLLLKISVISLEKKNKTASKDPK